MSAILNSLCRLCAKPNKQLLFLQKEMVYQISLMFEMHIGQFDNDQISKRICRRCRCIVLKSWNFFKQIHAAQKFFADFFSAEDNVETIVICPEQSEMRDFSKSFESSNEDSIGSSDIENLQTSKNVDQNNSDTVKIDSKDTPKEIVETHVLDSENNLAAANATKWLQNKMQSNENEIIENKNGNIKNIRKECHPTHSYVCSICDEGFDDEESLKCHMRAHRRAKPFKCYLCRFRYNDLPYWHSHLRTIHGVVFKVAENHDSNEETADSPENYVEKRPKY